MDRMPLVDLPPDVSARLAELGARPINLYRALANHPALLRAYLEFTWALRRDCKTPRRLRELMIVRGAQICDSAYELDQHRTMAKRAGISEDELTALRDWRESRLFSLAERAALGFMEEVLSLAVSDATVGELQRHFSDAERVELALTAAFYAMVPRVLDAFGVALDPPHLRLEIGADR